MSVPGDVAIVPTSSHQRRAETALAAAILAVAVFALILGFTSVGRPGVYPTSHAATVGAFGLTATLLVLGVILRRRRPDNLVGWLFLGMGALGSLTALTWATMLATGAPGGDSAFGAAAVILGSALTFPLWTGLITAVIVRFPTGRPESPAEASILRWQPWLGVVAFVAIALRPGRILNYPAYDNPIGTPAGLHDVLVAFAVAAVAASIVPAIVASGFMVRRYRRASAVQRLQLRWFAFGAGLLVIASVLYVAVGTFLAAENPTTRELAYLGWTAAGCFLPIAIFIAITRHRLYDIDRIIGRTVAYGALTAILAGLYAASLRLFNAAFVATTGESSEAALVLTTLVLATTFTPIKGRLERAAARRFPVEAPDEVASDSSGEAAASTAELDERIEAIARWVAREVAREVVAEGRPRPPDR